MGDLWDVDITSLADKIRGHLLPNMTILFTAAPPCKDHSKIRDAPPGVTGQDGPLLQHTVDIELSLRQLFPEHQFESIIENVLPHTDVQPHFDDITDQWGSQPMVCDAADGNMVSRPRLWWNTIHWPEIQQSLSSKTPWQQHGQYDKLHNPLAAELQPPIHIKGWENSRHPLTGRHIPLPHNTSQQTQADHHPNTRTSTKPLGNGGKRTTNSFPTMAIPTTIS